jgi:type III pantothenate kinase
MLLAVDIGNTQTSFGIYQASKLTQHWRAETKVSRTADEYLALLYPLMTRAGIKETDLEGVVVCSVVPSADRAFDQFCQSYWNLTPYRVDYRMNLGFGIRVDVPSEVGADRLANAAYAVRFLKLPAIVVDFGTATTFDVVSADRHYEGGVILPGVRIALEALSSRTSKLPLVEMGFPKSVIGKNTVQCIQAGILYGYCDMIDGLLKRTVDELGAAADVVLTGGYSALLKPHLKTSSQVLPNLTLDGIELLYNLNRR